MTIGHDERRTTTRAANPVARPFSGRKSANAADEALPDDALDLIARAEKLVYLFPEGFDSSALVEHQLAAAAAPVFEFDAHLDPEAAPAPPKDGAAAPHTFVGRVGPSAFAIEVRPRSATIIADPFGLRRDLLLVIKEYAERRRREESQAA